MNNHPSPYQMIIRGLLIPVLILTGCTQTSSPLSNSNPLMEGVQTLQQGDEGINPFSINFSQEGQWEGKVLYILNSTINLVNRESKTCSLQNAVEGCPLNRTQIQKVISQLISKGDIKYQEPTYQGISSFSDEAIGSFIVHDITYERTHDNKYIILKQKNADFKILSDHSYINSGSQIIFEDTGKPIIIMLQGNHTISTHGEDGFGNDYYYNQNAVINIKANDAPAYFQTHITLPQANNTLFTYDFVTSLINNNKNLEAQIDIPMDINFALTLKGYHRSKNTIPTGVLFDKNGKRIASVSFSTSGNDATAILKNLIKNTEYYIDISYPGQQEKIMRVRFTTRNVFENQISKNIVQHPIGSTGTNENKNGYQGIWNEYYGYRNITDEYNNNYHLCFSQPLDEEKSRSALEKTLGSEAFSLAFSVNNEEYRYEKNKNKCMMFYYYLNPEQTHQFEIKNISSLYGELAKATINIPKYKPSTQHTFVTIVGNMINVLPLKGTLGSTLQINYKNIKTTDLYLRSCQLITDRSQISKNLQKQSTQNTDTQEIIHAFLECGATKKQTYTFSNFQRRKSKVENIDLKKLFGNTLPNIFQIGVSDFKEGASKVFLRTNIGVLTKKSKDKLHIRTYALDTGKPINNVQILRGTLSGNARSTGTKNGADSNYIILPWKAKIGVVKLQIPNDQTLVIVSDPRTDRESSEGKRTSFKNNFGVDPYQIGGTNMRRQGDGRRIFGYSDRVLYKSEDRIFVSGWVRKPGSQNKPNGSVSVELKGPEGENIQTQTIQKLDAFGGYTAQFTLPKNPKLGTYYITSIYSDPQNPDNGTQYTSYLQVQEYKKSNIDLNSKLIEHQGENYLSIRPVYYFGGSLEEYTISMNYTLQGNNYGLYDRTSCGSQWCNSPIVYNYIRGQEITKNGNSSISNYKKASIDIPLKDLQVSSVSTLNMDIQLTDARTSESVQRFISTKIYPQYLIGLKGYEYQRVDLKSAKNYTIEGRVLSLTRTDKNDLENYVPLKEAKKQDTAQIFVYFKPYTVSTEKGPDEQWYFANGEEYKLIQNKQISLQNDGSFKENISLDKVGKYFFRVQYGKSETQRTVSIRENNAYNPYSFFGDMSNNYKLNIQIDPKEYKDGEIAKVYIEPYIKGAQTILSVEKEGEILYQAQKVLDGNPLEIKINKDRYPNAHISVTQIVGEETNSQISKERKEPRFFIGYTNVTLSPESMKIQYDVKITDLQGNKKGVFQPGEEIKVKVITKDFKGNPIASRLTAGIVDKALLDIYDEIRKPLEAIYQFSQAGISISTNLKNIYLALKVFSQDGTKGGGGAGGNGGAINPGTPRKDFFDVAFRRGALLSSPQGVVEFTTKLPDNLTTRTLDLIAVGAKGEMGVHRSTFKVAKEIMIQANLPRFIGTYDRIAVPVTVINNSNLTGAQLSGYIKVGTSSQKINFYTFEEKTYFDLSLENFSGHEIISSDLVTIALEVRGKDFMIQNIPLRKENSFITQYWSSEKAKDSTKISLSPTSRQGVLSITVAKLPSEVVTNAIKYLLHYPYGCTEQLLSTVYPLILTQDPQIKTLLSLEILSGNTVYLNGKREETKPLIQDAITRILKNQKPNGLMGYRPGNDDAYFNYELSLYTYQVLSTVIKQGHSIDMNAYKKLENALTNYKQSTPTQGLQLFLVQTLGGKTVNTARVEELIKNSKNTVDKILAYTILAMNNTRKQNWEQDIENYFAKTSIYGGEYISYNTAKAYYIRGLIKNGQLTKALNMLLELRKQVNSQGNRGRSTQENIQIILAFTDYFKAIGNDKKQISFTLKTLGKTLKETLNEKKTSHTFTIPFDQINNVDIDINASDLVLSDAKIQYLPDEITSFKNDGKNTTLNLKAANGETLSRILTTAPLGSKHTLNASFKVTQKARQVAVVIPIPASTFIINPALQQTTQNSNEYYYYGFDNENKFLKFTNTEKSDQRYTCQPRYYEIRFDQLFLYYEEIEAGAGCQVAFDIIKTHQGQIPFLQMQLFEMYHAQTRGTVFIKL